MKISWFGIYDPNYSRNSVLMRGLRENGVEVVECREDYKSKGRYKRLIASLKSLRGGIDVIYAAYPAPVATILAKLFGGRKPVIMDAFYSMYDAVVNDRKETPWFHPRALRLLILDWAALLMADKIITDTEAHKAYWSKWWFVNAKKIKAIYIGADDTIFRPLKNPAAYSKSSSGNFLVHFHGKYIPLQGVPIIVEAARLLKDNPSIKFRLVGSGSESKKVDNLIQKYVLKNIETIGRVSLEQLNTYENEADVILGIFGDTEKAKRVIPNKVYEGVAVKKPVITMDAPAIREVFTDEDLCLIKNDPQELARAILELQMSQEKSNSLAAHSYDTFQKNFRPKILGAKLRDICLSLVKPLE